MSQEQVTLGFTRLYIAVAHKRFTNIGDVTSNEDRG